MTSEQKECFRVRYQSDLTDIQWSVLEPHVPHAKCSQKKGGRPEKYTKREIINGILYVKSSGCRWRDLPHDLPPWPTVFHYFNTWSKQGIWKRINAKLRKLVRSKRGRNEDPSVGIVDSQTVKGVDITEDSGYDAGKKTKGRKRHLITDTQGLLIDAVVHSAGIQDRDGAKILFHHARKAIATIEKIFADGGYAGKLIEWVKKRFGIVLEIVKRSNLKGFVALPKRWIIERTNAWIVKARRMSKEYERTTRNEESMIYVTMIHLMLRWVI